MPDRKTRERGREAENAARVHLEAHGLATLARNFQTRWGELDLVMDDRGQVVIVEVRYRSNNMFGGAAASVTAAKQGRLARAASQFLARARLGHRPVRFDIVAVEGADQRIDWIIDAFRPAN